MEQIDILMATYNGEKYIKEQIESILKQNNVDLTLFIYDDISKDSTIEILKEYEDRARFVWERCYLTYEQQREIVDNLLKEFVKDV